MVAMGNMWIYMIIHPFPLIIDFHLIFTLYTILKAHFNIPKGEPENYTFSREQ